MTVAAVGLLFFLRFTVNRGLGQGEDQDLFAGDGADVVVQAHHPDSGHLLHHCPQERPRRFDQMVSHLFEQVPPFLGWEGLDQMLFGGGQDALKTPQYTIIEKVCVDVLGASAHVFLFEATSPFADGGFNFPLRFHAHPERIFSFSRPIARPRVRKSGHRLAVVPA